MLGAEHGCFDFCEYTVRYGGWLETDGVVRMMVLTSTCAYSILDVAPELKILQERRGGSAEGSQRQRHFFLE